MELNLLDTQQLQIKYDRYQIEKSSFSKSYQLLWICGGSGKFTINQNIINLEYDKLLFIPIASTYTVIPDGELTLVKIYFPKRYVTLNSNADFRLLNVDKSEIKRALATYLYRFNKRADFKIEDESNQLITTVLKHSEATELFAIPVRDTRVLETLHYIDIYVNNRFTVNDIATKLHVNPTYLSTLFKNEVGTTIVKYTNTLRLELALRDIQQTTLSITKIAFNHGFADVRTLGEMTKLRYGLTPMQIRIRTTVNSAETTTKDSFRLIIDKYRDKDEVKATIKQQIKANFEQSNSQFNHSFNTVAIGRAHDILYTNVQDTLIRAKKSLNFKYCRFHNIFGDEMNIFDNDYSNNTCFSFQKPLRVIEFLLNNKITPFIELGFFPKEIADQSMSVFTGYNANVGGEINFSLWEQLIEAFFNQLIATFPADYLTMRFDFWNEIDIKAFWPGSKADLYKLYKITYKTIKRIDHNIKLGGFNYGNFFEQTEQIENDMQQLARDGYLPDFLTIHSYPVYIDSSMSHNPDLAVSEIKAKYIKDKLNLDLDILVNLKEKYNFEEVYISEWNTSPMQREHLNDGLYKSSKIISEILNAKSQLIDGICYWTLSDEMVEFGYPANEVHGGFGLFTRSGIPKPAFYGMKAATMISGNILYQNRNVIVTENQQMLFILANNDIGYVRNYLNNSFNHNPQTMEGNRMLIDLEVDNMTPGMYIEETYMLTPANDLNLNFDYLFANNNYLLDAQIKQLINLSRPTKTSQIHELKTSYQTIIDLGVTCSTLIIIRKC